MERRLETLFGPSVPEVTSDGALLTCVCVRYLQPQLVFFFKTLKHVQRSSFSVCRNISSPVCVIGLFLAPVGGGCRKVEADINIRCLILLVRFFLIV